MTETNKEKGGLVIQRSPIEFVVVGAKGWSDGVLVRSEGCPLDLVGFAAVYPSASEDSPTADNLVSWYRPRTMWAVESYPISPDSNDWEDRKSVMRFCWVGLCTKADEKKINSVFNQHAADLRAGITKRNMERVEWSLASVIFYCAAAHSRIKGRRRLLLILAVVYCLLLCMTAGAWILWELARASRAPKSSPASKPSVPVTGYSSSKEKRSHRSTYMP